MFQHKIVEEFGLTRHKLPRAHHGAYRYLTCADIVPTVLDWTSHEVRKGPSPLHNYTLSRKAQTYIIEGIFLHTPDDPQDRYTDARLWQIVVDGWLRAGAKLADLRFIGVHWVENAAAKASMRDGEFGNVTASKLHRVFDLNEDEAQMITLTPSSADCWEDHPFIRSGIRVAAALTELAGVEVVVKRVMCICNNGNVAADNAAFFMAIELEVPEF